MNDTSLIIPIQDKYSNTGIILDEIFPFDSPPFFFKFPPNVRNFLYRTSLYSLAVTIRSTGFTRRAATFVGFMFLLRIRNLQASLYLLRS